MRHFERKKSATCISVKRLCAHVIPMNSVVPSSSGWSPYFAYGIAAIGCQVWEKGIEE